ncbi:MAG TPA: hypothetical protein VF234_02780 [Limnochordia bacterium]
MSQITAKELACLEELLYTEQSQYEKFCAYAALAADSAVQKLAEQLADRSREHFQALVDVLTDEAPAGG